ncbi:unnamed protein product [Orchesella dallaii]|uniref:Uncharacterized protein n=1 Tax=Orchesella dallaii TaxID=48710 RepID=A0ABP1PMY2_9HEXA
MSVVPVLARTSLRLSLSGNLTQSLLPPSFCLDVTCAILFTLLTFSGAVGLHGCSYEDLHTLNIITKEWPTLNVVGKRPPSLMAEYWNIFASESLRVGLQNGHLRESNHSLWRLEGGWHLLIRSLRTGHTGLGKVEGGTDSATPGFPTDARPCAQRGHSFTTVDGNIYCLRT